MSSAGRMEMQINVLLNEPPPPPCGRMGAFKGALDVGAPSVACRFFKMAMLNYSCL